MLGCGKVAGKGAGAEDGNRTVGEGDNGRGADWAGPVNQVVEQVPVAQMHTIEHADGQHRVPIRRVAGQALAEAHRFCVPLLVTECRFVCCDVCSVARMLAQRPRSVNLKRRRSRFIYWSNS